MSRPSLNFPPAGGGGQTNVMFNNPPPTTGRNVKCGPYHAPLRRYMAVKNEISITGNRQIFRQM